MPNDHTATTNTTEGPRGERTALVHKKDAEGALIISGLTGLITQPIDERPEWSEGLTCALLAERHGWYTKRLGPQYAKDHASPEAFAYEDLGWIGVDAEGNPVELEADTEHRMTVIADVIGAHRSNDLSDTTQDSTKGEMAHVLIDMDTLRTVDEASALDKATHANFDEVTNTGTK